MRWTPPALSPPWQLCQGTNNTPAVRTALRNLPATLATSQPISASGTSAPGAACVQPGGSFLPTDRTDGEGSDLD